ncbi:hypothetical protein [Lambdina fiscellaria nucleopolyhedrovirus]|uniref:Uncharacterized protein n=1 Tax=Lambdina fiscellaria nucleopolyhedrovirus TaxID=1642929 RepID=A0A0E3URC7_9ABAC|nr:hypothetical protein [Lambdina fiscellaria nucleopolyhedrovirus]AKC91725.1 hypothetical protein [Lambdina fiscellaria nucleopolyhedrovirus]
MRSWCLCRCVRSKTESLIKTLHSIYFVKFVCFLCLQLNTNKLTLFFNIFVKRMIKLMKCKYSCNQLYLCTCVCMKKEMFKINVILLYNISTFISSKCTQARRRRFIHFFNFSQTHPSHLVTTVFTVFFLDSSSVSSTRFNTLVVQATVGGVCKKLKFLRRRCDIIHGQNNKN